MIRMTELYLKLRQCGDDENGYDDGGDDDVGGIKSVFVL